MPRCDGVVCARGSTFKVAASQNHKRLVAANKFWVMCRYEQEMVLRADHIVQRLLEMQNDFFERLSIGQGHDCLVGQTSFIASVCVVIHSCI